MYRYTKMVASSVTYPHEVIRSHMHVQGLGPFDGVMALVKRIHREGGGVKAFYRGVGTNLVGLCTSWNSVETHSLKAPGLN